MRAVPYLYVWGAHCAAVLACLAHLPILLSVDCLTHTNALGCIIQDAHQQPRIHSSVGHLTNPLSSVLPFCASFYSVRSYVSAGVPGSGGSAL